MSPYKRGVPYSDRLPMVLIGGLVGLVFTCCTGGLFLLGGGSSSAPNVASQPPAQYDIEVIVEEDYINRTMVENAAGVVSAFPLVAGHLDIHPGGRADFVAQVEIGPLRPVFKGTLAFQATDTGQLELRFSRVMAGYLPVTALVPAGQKRALNQALNRMIAERAGPFDLRIAGVASDETTLRFYLTVLQ